MFQKHKLSFVFFLQKERGVTLIELSLVIALVTILIALSIPVYSKLQITSQLNESTSLLVQTLRTAQGRSVARLNNVKHGIKLEIDSYTLYYGCPYRFPVMSQLYSNYPGNGGREQKYYLVSA